tara:strand:- start:2071 stop:2670 length:600 start_codon:yes stop_codon:yes gene_type:complete
MEFFDKLSKGIILIYGSAATGKTTFGLQKSLEISKKGKVLFLDTENTFSLERIKQMDENYEEHIDNILIVKPKSFEDLNKKVKLFEELNDRFDLVVLDSFGIFYRLDLQKRGYIEANDLAVDVLRKLRHIAEKVPVIITNQVYEDEAGKHALGGKMIQNFSDYILELQTNPKIIDMKKPVKEKLKFEIINRGLVISSLD